jgi:dTDP-4-amino-4,6-dideoxygalactose transaminase
MKIPYYGLGSFYQKFKSEFDRVTLSGLASGQYFSEVTIAAFEEKLASVCQRSFAVTTASCTDALFFALDALGIQKNDKIAVPSVSFIATVTPVLRAGASPVFVDIDPATGLISEAHLESVLKQHSVKAVITVDLYGNMVDPEMITRFQKQYAIPFLSDAAQSLGSKRNGQAAGSTGRIGCVSFDPTKVIHSFGAGGAVLTDDEQVAEKIRMLRYHGKSGNEHYFHGYNSRLNSLQAGLLQIQLDHLAEIIDNRTGTADAYRKALQGSEKIQCIRDESEINNAHKFVVLCKDREAVRASLEKQGIQTMIHYSTPLFFHRIFETQDFIAERIDAAGSYCNKVLSLPLHSFMPQQEIDYVCDVLHQIK